VVNLIVAFGNYKQPYDVIDEYKMDINMMHGRIDFNAMKNTSFMNTRPLYVNVNFHGV
jgi:hypothetical protein